MAGDYVDAQSQTVIAGLSKHPSPVPPMLSDTNTTTPPEDMPGKDLQLQTDSTPAIMRTAPSDSNSSPTLLLRRKNRPPLVARISMPASNLDAEGPRSPPPTESVLSPLPAANRLHAGHTPIFPRSMSPLPQDDSGPATPEQEEALQEDALQEDEALSGPLTLPARPGDGAEDRIELRVLDAELEKIAKEQGEAIESRSSPPSQSAEFGGQHSRKGSSESGHRRSSADETTEVVDGVLLKKPRMNMGAPLGQA